MKKSRETPPGRRKRPRPAPRRSRPYVIYATEDRGIRFEMKAEPNFRLT